MTDYPFRLQASIFLLSPTLYCFLEIILRYMSYSIPYVDSNWFGFSYLLILLSLYLKKIKNYVYVFSKQMQCSYHPGSVIFGEFNFINKTFGWNGSFRHAPSQVNFLWILHSKTKVLWWQRFNWKAKGSHFNMEVIKFSSSSYQKLGTPSKRNL